MKKEFFLISQVFYPDEVSTAGLFTNLCEELIKKDVSVTVWCAQPSYNIKKRQARKTIYKGINIQYLPSTNFNNNVLAGRLLNYFTFSTSLFFKLIISNKKNPIFTSTNPPYLGFLISIVCKIRKRKFNYIIQDVFPDGVVKLGKLSENGVLARLWKRVNIFTLKQCSIVIIIGRDMMSWVRETYEPAVHKTRYIPIWQDDTLIKPIPFSENKFVVDNSFTNNFIVQYSGNMGLWNDLKTFGYAANKIDDAEVIFTFIGDGIRKPELDKVLTENNRNNFRFFPFQPRGIIGLTLTACHLALVSLDKGLEGIAVPSKIMGILAAGIPVIAMVPANSEIAYIINENKCGRIIEPGNTKELINSIKDLKLNESLRLKMGQNARLAFENKYSTSIVASHYLKFI